MTEAQDENTRPDTDLRDHLHQMEAKVRKLTRFKEQPQRAS